MITLAVDAVGGDSGLVVIAPGATTFLKQQRDVRLTMVGDEAAVHETPVEVGAPTERTTIRHAARMVEVDEVPQSVLKNKKDSSMRIAINQAKEGNAQAAASVGNTDVLMATARFVPKTTAGIEHPAIVKFIPSAGNHMMLVFDLGVNMDCSADQLTQFAVTDSELLQTFYPEKGRPYVGLSNVSTGDIKDTDMAKQAFKLLRDSKPSFVGNVEGNSVFTGEVDMVVADGSVGNIMLKTTEGAVKFIDSAIREEFQHTLFNKLVAVAAIPALEGTENKLDSRKFNGAIFLGLCGVVIKSHDGIDQTGFMYALEEVCHEARTASLSKIE